MQKKIRVRILTKAVDVSIRMELCLKKGQPYISNPEQMQWTLKIQLVISFLNTQKALKGHRGHAEGEDVS